MGRGKREEIDAIQWGFTWLSFLDQINGEIEEENEENVWGRKADEIRESVCFGSKQEKENQRGKVDNKEK